MDLLQEIKTYIALQSSIIEEINSNLINTGKECISFDNAWKLDSSLESGWVLTPHGEHIQCTHPPELISVEIPLLAPNMRGVDAGHFDYYLTTIGKECLGYREMCQALEALEKAGSLISIHGSNLPVIWQLINDKT